MSGWLGLVGRQRGEVGVGLVVLNTCRMLNHSPTIRFRLPLTSGSVSRRSTCCAIPLSVARPPLAAACRAAASGIESRKRNESWLAVSYGVSVVVSVLPTRPCPSVWRGPSSVRKMNDGDCSSASTIRLMPVLKSGGSALVERAHQRRDLVVAQRTPEGARAERLREAHRAGRRIVAA